MTAPEYWLSVEDAPAEPDVEVLPRSLEAYNEAQWPQHLPWRPARVNSGHNIVKTVFIQCGSGYRTSGPEEMRPVGESEFVWAIAEEGDRRGGNTKICAGIVSFADLRLPNVDAVLEGQIAAAGGFAAFVRSPRMIRRLSLRRFMCRRRG